MYSQNNEDLHVARYFGDKAGTLLEIGANNGIDLSNSLYLIGKGWHAHLVEPASVYENLLNVHKANHKVHVHNCAIDTEDYVGSIFESGAHVPHGTDRALVSTMVKSEMDRWPKVKFEEKECACVCWDTFYNHIDSPQIDFISIDAEGKDYDILKQIDLTAVGCSCLCIEWNSKQDLLDKYTSYAMQHGMRVLVINPENVIYVR